MLHKAKTGMGCIVIEVTKPTRITNDKMLESKEVIVIDTCVLLADPNAIERIHDSEIVIPLTVIEELDNQKTRLDDVGRSARTIIKKLEQLRINAGGDLSHSIEIGENSSLRIEINGLRLEELEKLGLPTTKNDNRIIAAALGLAKSGRKVKIISIDTNMRIKAASLGIEAQDWDNYGKIISNESSGWDTYELESEELIDALYEEHVVSKRVYLDMFPNLELEEHRGYGVLKYVKKSVLVKFEEDEIRVVNSNKKPWGLTPKSKEQHFALDMLLDDETKIVAISGPAGTGKTILTLAAALEQTFENRNRRFDRVMVIRPVIAIGKQDIGFLPGTKEEKLGNWFEAVVDTMVALGDNVTYESAAKNIDLWTNSNRLVYEPITYLRGRSLQKTFIIVDEAQNLEPSSLKTILTRVGEGSKIVFLGDTTQIDNIYVSNNTNALSVLIDRFSSVPIFSHIKLEKGERSDIANYAAEIL